MALSPTSSRGGGFTPVSCYLTGPAVDCKAAATHVFKWNAVFDNVFDSNPLGAIPTGLGLSTPLDASSANVTVTAAPGVWLYEFQVSLPATDATFVADFSAAFGFASERMGPVAGGSESPSLSSHFYAAATDVGSASQFALTTVIAATGVTYNVTPLLVLTRIA